MLKIVIQNDAEYMALRRCISRNKLAAPEKDQPHLERIYKTMCDFDLLPPETIDMFFETKE